MIRLETSKIPQILITDTEKYQLKICKIYVSNNVTVKPSLAAEREQGITILGNPTVIIFID